EEIGSSSNVDKQEITQLPAVYDDQKKPPKFEMDDQVAILVDNEAADALFDSVLECDWERVKELNSVKKVVKLMPRKVLEYKTTENGFTALHTAARYGYTEGAMVKHLGLTQIRHSKGMTPLEVALRHVTILQKEIVECLHSKTRDVEPSPFLGNDGVRLLCSGIDANFYRMALSLVKRFPKLVMEKSLVHEMCGFVGPKAVCISYWRKADMVAAMHLFIQCLMCDTAIHVDIDSTYPSKCVDDTERDEENPSENSSEGTEGDEENPEENSEDNEVLDESLSENSEETSTSDTGAMAMFVSVYLMAYLKRGNYP
ncbi:hypothetical protein MKX01_006434, partial [Papaver californicum]